MSKYDFITSEFQGITNVSDEHGNLIGQYVAERNGRFTAYIDFAEIGKYRSERSAQAAIIERHEFRLANPYLTITGRT